MMHRLNNTYLPSICAHQDISRKFVSQNTKKYTKGDTLLILDDREYKIRVMEAEAALKGCTSQCHSHWCHTTNHANYSPSVYDASIAEIEIRLTKLEKDRQRYQNLVKRNAATPIPIGTDRNRICSYPQEVGSRETTTESCLVGCERSVTSP